MALVTVDQAKTHLRITDDAMNADVAFKVDQASAIVLDYLKNRLTAIASISAANPAVITTSVPHSLLNGGSYTIAGTTTTPTVNGAQAVTVLTSTTFTVPVNVTVGQAATAGTVGTVAWAAATAPLPVQAATLLLVGHLYENRGHDMVSDENLWKSLERLLIRFRDPAFA